MRVGHRLGHRLGGWDDEINALDTVMDDLGWPATEVARAIGAVARVTPAMLREVLGKVVDLPAAAPASVA